MYFSLCNSIITANTEQNSFSALNSETLEQTCQITGAAGSGPHGLTVCRSRQFLYAANSYDRSISVVDCLRGTLADCISVGTTPVHLTLCKPKGCLYVTNFDSDSVSVIRMEDMQQILCIPVGRMPHDIHYAKESGLIFVAENGMNCVSVIDPEQNRVIHKIRLHSAPMHFKEGPCGRYLYTAGSIYEKKAVGEIDVIDVKTMTVAASYQLGNYLTDVCTDPGEKTIYAADGGNGCIYELNSENGSIRRCLKMGGFPSAIGYIKNEAKPMLALGDHMTGKITTYDAQSMGTLSASPVFQDLNHFLIL